MKTAGFLVVLMLLELLLMAQVPHAINYQAVARDLEGEVIQNRDIAVRINILKGNPLMRNNADILPRHSVYEEVHEVKTNRFGLFNIAIGRGQGDGGFSAINWSLGPYYIRVELDPGGNNQYHFMGMSQILSVPYALYAEKAGRVADNMVLTSPDNRKWKLNVDNEGNVSARALTRKRWHTGTVKDYTGLDGCKYILELDHGKKLEPHQVSGDSAFQFYDGQRVKLQFTPLPGVASICMAGDIVRIDRIVEISGTNSCKPVINKAPADSFAMDPVRINRISLEDQCLLINVSYSGGCKQHEFNLIHDSRLASPGGTSSNDSRLASPGGTSSNDSRLASPGGTSSSSPLQAFVLSHEGNGDRCEAYLTETLKFNVAAFLQPDQEKFAFNLQYGEQVQQLFTVYHQGQNPGKEPVTADTLLSYELHKLGQDLPENWSSRVQAYSPDSFPKIGMVPAPLAAVEFINKADTYIVNGHEFNQQLVLYFYPLSMKTTIEGIIDKSQMYSSCIPSFYKETERYYIITSPCFNRLSCETRPDGSCGNEINRLVKAFITAYE